LGGSEGKHGVSFIKLLWAAGSQGTSAQPISTGYGVGPAPAIYNKNYSRKIKRIQIKKGGISWQL
jgi:hypothetical protein